MKRKACDKCNGKGRWVGVSTSGKCYKCNGKGWLTPQNVINWAAAQRKLLLKVHPSPLQYKDS